MSEESYKVSFEHTDDGKQIVTVKSTTVESRAASPDEAIFGKIDNKYALFKTNNLEEAIKMSRFLQDKFNMEICLGI